MGSILNVKINNMLVIALLQEKTLESCATVRNQAHQIPLHPNLSGTLIYVLPAQDPTMTLTLGCLSNWSTIIMLLNQWATRPLSYEANTI